METIAIRVFLAVLALAVSARTRLTAVIAGHPYSAPVLMIAAVIVILVAAAAMLWAVRMLVHEGLRLRPRVAAA